TYLGDIYTVPVNGGSAARLTSLPSIESSPVWSPDSKNIAFASDRNGQNDVFIMPAQGGSAVQLTSYSTGEIPLAFTPDGKSVIYSASIQDPASSMQFPSRRLSELYKVSTDGGRFTQFVATPADNIAFSPDGKVMLYEDIKGMENRFRKHHTSAVTSDIWSYDVASGRHSNLTSRGGEDRNPVITSDGNTVYFLSERDGGSFNVYSAPIGDLSKAKKITDFAMHPVRFLSVSDSGMLVFGFNGEIYTMNPGAQPQKVDIDVVVDSTPDVVKQSVSRATEAEVSPSGKQVAFIHRGEVFVTSTDYPSVKQITNTPEGESDLVWGQNDRELYYTSERDGNYNIYKAVIKRAADSNFSNATIVEETPVFAVDGHDRTMPSLSPDGNYLAFVLDRNKLMVMDTNTHKVRQLTDGSTYCRRTKGFKANWSPDSRMIAINYIEPSHDPYGDIAVIDMATGKLTKITATGYFDESPRWALDGKALIWASERYGMRNHASWGSQYDVMMAFLTEDAYNRFRLSEEDYALVKDVEKARKKNSGENTGKSEKNKKKGDKTAKDTVSTEKWIPDFDNVEVRTIRLTPNSSDLADAILSEDGETLYYLSKFEKGYDLWKRQLRKGDTKIAHKLGESSAIGLQMDKDGKLYLVGGSVKKYDPKTDKVSPVKISASMELDRDKEREYMLRHVFNEERERFYDKGMHGVDWDSLYANYSRFLPHINNNEDFAELLSEMLGELNVSHTGASYRSTKSPKDVVASLGLFYDLTDTGKGLKVTEVVKGGPLDFAESKLKPGARITAINGIEFDDERSPFELLVNVTGKKTLVTYVNPDGKTHSEVVIPMSDAKFNALLYDRWVERCRAMVDSLSGGRLGYVHIQSMDDASYRKIYADMLGKYVDREGIVVDTRWNGGGRLHEDIEVLLSGKTYLMQEIHGMKTAPMPSRRWNKPSIMLMCEANYSNAHGTPWVYNHLGLGKLVGTPVPGTMTSVNWQKLQDPTLTFGIPVTGYRTDEGTYLENAQLEPDIYVVNNPQSLTAGEDAQLKAAVKALLEEIDSKKQ
ncbi:MAG: peptidase S41, partial [Paramuribaculum sp.]|nr:peptidase S41 [Paramuribaculum sp.]